MVKQRVFFLLVEPMLFDIIYFTDRKLKLFLFQYFAHPCFNKQRFSRIRLSMNKENVGYKLIFVECELLWKNLMYLAIFFCISFYLMLPNNNSTTQDD